MVRLYKGFAIGMLKIASENAIGMLLCLELHAIGMLSTCHRHAENLNKLNNSYLTVMGVKAIFGGRKKNGKWDLNQRSRAWEARTHLQKFIFFFSPLENGPKSLKHLYVVCPTL